MSSLPITVKRSLELLGLVLVGLLISIGKPVIMPLLMAFFLSILLLPMYRFFKRRLRFPDGLAIVICIIIMILAIAGISWFFGAQVAALVSDIPTLKQNVAGHWQKLSHWIETHTPFSAKEQSAWLATQSDGLLSNAGTYLGSFAGSASSVFVFFGLLPIYIFLIMYYKNLLLRFTYLWFDQQDHEMVTEALLETESIIKSYLIGLVFQITYITILLGGLLMLLGIKHAILIGVMFAFLNLIPYLGALIGNLLGVLLTLTSSEELWKVVAVLGAIAVVQFLDNNILMPRIVGSKVKLNSLVSIVGIFVGGSLAGVAGMFLSLPIMAVMKIIFDKTNAFRQWGVLLGEANPKLSPISHPALRLKNRRLRESEVKDDNDAQPEQKERPEDT